MSENEMDEIVKLVSKVDISTVEKKRIFKFWQYNDGSLAGLKTLIQSGALNANTENR